MQGARLGPVFLNDEVKKQLQRLGAVYTEFDESELIDTTAKMLADGKIVGWFQGRMEFGPRALGSRSILGDPHSADMQSKMNLKIKFRESFRPFAPAVLRGKVSEYFDLDADSPYMLLVAPVSEKHQISGVGDDQAFGFDKLKVRRSTIPAVTHVDMSARVQTVASDDNQRFYSLIERFGNITGDPVLINTSFNVRGEPIVCTPEDAFKCFMRTGMDYLVIENLILDKTQQPEGAVSMNDDWQAEFPLD